MYCARGLKGASPRTAAAHRLRGGSRVGLGAGRRNARPHAQAKVKSSAPPESFSEYTSSDLVDGDRQADEGASEASNEVAKKKINVNVDISKVKSFLTNVVDSTEIAEIDLQVGDMELYVLRKVTGSSAAAPAPVAAAPAPAAAPAAPAASVDQEDDHEGSSLDESAVLLTSETVGTFRRGRYAKGKKIGKKSMVEEGSTVKKGQTIAFVEQMGTFTPVLAKQAGEIIKFEVEEGEPVGYGHTLATLYPFFGGHIIGESKHV